MMKNLIILVFAIVLFSKMATADTIKVDGITALTGQEVSAVLDAYQGGEIEAEQIAAIINQLNSLYREKGFLNSGVMFPAQTKSELVRLQAVEGELDKINVTTEGRLSLSHVERLIRAEVGLPLNINDLQGAFNRLERDDAIEAVKGRLIPGSDGTKSVLNLEVVEADAFSIAVKANNYRSPSVGAEQFQIALAHINLTGHSDELSFGLNHTEGLDSGSIYYSFPVHALRSRIAVFYSKGDTIVVEAPFDAIELESETDTTGFSIKTAFIDSLTRALSLQLGLEQKQSTTSLFGMPFDFTQGSLDGASNAAIVSASLAFEHRSRQQAFSGRVSWRHGLDALDATILPNGLPDGQFDLMQLQLSYVRLFARAAHDWTLSLSFNSQFTSDTLQAFERLPLGGHQSIRGFRENQVLRDEAWEFRAQLDIPIYQEGESRFVIFPFYDAGEGKNAIEQSNVRQSVSLSSVGIGMHYQFEGFSFLLEWASRLEEEQKQDDTLQDDGLHVGVSYVF
jgi:hemolysin activation/secretion protein